MSIFDAQLKLIIREVYSSKFLQITTTKYRLKMPKSELALYIFLALNILTV